MDSIVTQLPSISAQAAESLEASDAISTLYRLIRPWVFRSDPEQAHRATLLLLRLAGETLPGQLMMRALFPAQAGTHVQAFGLDFPNPVGLAAGYDKDATAWRGLARMGFGHIEIGTVTPRPQPGNPSPRIFRLVEDEAVINRMGFPNQGAAAVARRLRGPRPKGLVLGVNIGKNKMTPLEAAGQDYLDLLRTFAPLADYLTVNVSSPNTPGLRELQTYDALRSLLELLAQERSALQTALKKPVPILVKLAPDLRLADLDGSLCAILESGMDGVILANTTLRRSRLASSKAEETGGLSGAPTEDFTVELIKTAYRCTAGQLPMVASGGVMNARSAQRMLDAGAALVQIYTGLIYAGPGLVHHLVERIG
jgi:dihydroorotate dehydrogenase